MRRLATLTLLAIGTITLIGCATMNVGSYAGRGIDFNHYRTYDWGPADALPTGDPRLDANAFFNDYFQGAIEQQLAARGLMRAEPGEAGDLLLHYHASIERRLQVNDVTGDSIYCPARDCGTVSEYEAGTLLIDIVDRQTNRLVWRGWTQTAVDGMLANQDVMERQTREAAARMIARLPRPLIRSVR